MDMCNGLKKDGNRCTRNCDDNSSYCWQHQPITIKIYDVSDSKYIYDFPERLMNDLIFGYKSLFSNLSSNQYLKEYMTYLTSLSDTPENDINSEKMRDISRHHQAIKDIRELLEEQLSYLDYYRMEDSYTDLLRNIEKDHSFSSVNKSCKIWFIVVYLGKYPYGGIFIFQDPKEPHRIMIQGISKFGIPAIVAAFYPELDANIPRLNSLLIPYVEDFAKTLGVSEILVSPIGKQGDILVKHYGFKAASKDYAFYPCKKIKGSTSPFAGNQFYIKQL